MTRRLLLLVFITLGILICKINSHGHGHSHDHGHGHAHDHGHGHGHAHDHGHDHGHAHDEPPSFKYSREANEAHHGHAHHEESVTYAPPHYNDGSDSDSDDDDDEKVAPFSVITWALLSTVGISLAPVVILAFIRVTDSPKDQSFLKILLSFASGGLLGDAFLHLIPHAMSAYGDNNGHGHSHSHSHDHNHAGDIQVGLYILLGIFLFLIVEKFVRHVKGHGHSHSHSHSHEVTTPVTPDDTDDDPNDKKKKKDKKSVKKTEVVPESRMKISGYLNLIADGLHNFTDGLAIGSTYLLGRKVGLTTTLTIFLHEIPHEIGDYAILIQNGCSRKKAILLQLTTAIGALLGCLIGLLFHSAGAEVWATQTFLPITAGGFIYIATVSVIPELLETNSGLKQSILEMIALIMGVLIMVGVALFE
ncbi:hypothetical protein I4U23_021646 [Adineta vaga]|nr:hypothetical protein I4U23_021646 [Adineta vaga]